MRDGRLGLPRYRGRTLLAVALPLLEVGPVVLVVDAIFEPQPGVREVLLKVDRLDVEAVLGVVQEQPELAIDVHGPKVLGRRAQQDDLVVAGVQVVAKASRPLVDVAEVVRIVDQHRAAVRVLLLQDDAVLGRLGVDVSAELLVEFGTGDRGDEALRDHRRTEPEALVELLPHRLQAGGAEDERGTIVRVADSQLAEQFRADERFAQAHDVADVAAAVLLDHPEAALDRVDLEVGERLAPNRQRQVSTANLRGVQLVKGLQVDVIRRRVIQRPGTIELGHEGFADVLGLGPEVVEPRL